MSAVSKTRAPVVNLHDLQMTFYFSQEILFGQNFDTFIQIFKYHKFVLCLGSSNRIGTSVIIKKYSS